MASVVRSDSPVAGTEGARTFRLPGNVYSHIITGLHTDTVYNVSVAAGTVQGFNGPAAYQIVTTGQGILVFIPL